MVGVGRHAKKDVICCNQHIDTGCGEMFQFKRGLSPDFVRRLNEEYESGGWWKHIADDDQLFVAIRNQYLNVYWKGNSLLELRLNGSDLVGLIHYKYLLRPDRKAAYINVLGGRPVIEDPAGLFLNSIDPERLRKAAAPYSGGEKDGVHQILLGNPNVIDVEIAFRRECDTGKPSRTVRIDFAAIQTGCNGPELGFFEAKRFANKEIRASKKAAQVEEQMDEYRRCLMEHEGQLLESYRTVIANLCTLKGKGIRERYSALHSLDTTELRICKEVGLVVFGYDSDQAREGSAGGRLFQELDRQLGGRLYRSGKPTSLKIPTMAHEVAHA